LRPHANRCFRRFVPVLGAAALVAGVAAAEPDTGGSVPLQQLLKLPAGAASGVSLGKRGGHTRSEWEELFRKARQDHEKAEASLVATRTALEKKAATEGGQWRVSAPGFGTAASAEGADTPLDYHLTQELRRNREEVARSERKIQDLEVEANLAGVPPDWRGEPEVPE